MYERFVITSPEFLSKPLSNSSSKLNKYFVEILIKKLQDENFAYIAGFNLFTNKKVNNKLTNFIQVLNFLSKLKHINYAIIKIGPLITNIGNDIDILVNFQDVYTLLKAINNVFGISKMRFEGWNEKLPRSRNIKIQIHLRNGFQIDVYTYIGWRLLTGLCEASKAFRYVGYGEIHILKYANDPYIGKITVKMLPIPLDSIIQTIHLVEHKNTINIADLLNLIYSLNYYVKDNVLDMISDVCAYPLALKLYSMLLSNMVSSIQSMFRRGILQIPLNLKIYGALYTIFYNLQSKHTEVWGYLRETNYTIRNILKTYIGA